mmetsp:Transcript_29438/g.83008  ORF Transcript_29438/g.83008 Transcript_29438/m.83008 type:complete len:200 (+) Transcript_29438:87-686(+)
MSDSLGDSPDWTGMSWDATSDSSYTKQCSPATSSSRCNECHWSSSTSGSFDHSECSSQESEIGGSLKVCAAESSLDKLLEILELGNPFTVGSAAQLLSCNRKRLRKNRIGRVMNLRGGARVVVAPPDLQTRSLGVSKQKNSSYPSRLSVISSRPISGQPRPMCGLQGPTTGGRPDRAANLTRARRGRAVHEPRAVTWRP